MNNNDEQFFKEKAANNMVCFNDTCPKATLCLRRHIASYVPTDQLSIKCVNPANHKITKGECPVFISKEKVKMAVGMMHLLDRVPYDTASYIKRNLIAELTRKRFYAYRKGAEPIPPKVRQRIAEVFLENGCSQTPQFDSFTEEYEW